jgi:DNA-directed RNA polymerase subunit RPC12/RpoP
MPYTYQKNEAGEFVCPVCKVTKARQNTMHYHMKKHESSLPFKCQHCSKEFLQATSLKIHVEAMHTREEKKMLSCPCCPFRTLTKANRIIHFMRHHCTEEEHATILEELDGGKYHCKACNKTLNSNTAYQYHAASCIQIQDATRSNALKQICA